LSRWVGERFPATGCTLAIDVKKTFMDEWTGVVDAVALEGMARRLASTTGPVLQALGRLVPGSLGSPAG
ncbi:MAG TPA: hypothetical protein VE173_11495, partial [Longimicrobiales bacterium]|nr:hypothetical protein [Longimicrobiales bacterium]